VIDDLYAYRVAPEEYLLVINASRIDPDVNMDAAATGRAGRRAAVQLENVSDQFGAVALQGPRTANSSTDVLPARQGRTQASKPSELKKNQLGIFDFNGKTFTSGGLGYTEGWLRNHR